MKYIAVVGGSSVNRAFYKAAYEAGREIASRNAAVVCGGLGGVMEAACKGAKSAGGLTIGILPGRRKEDANAYVDIAVPTGMSEARNAVIINMADGVLAVDGKEGTLSEIAFALKQKKPVTGFKTHEVKGVVRCDAPAIAVKKLFELMGA